MMRTKERDERPDERIRSGEFYTVSARYSTFYVDGATAARIGRSLERRWRPRWVKFTDLVGSRTWLRTDSIESIWESTPAQRERDRVFQRQRNDEARKDGPEWGDADRLDWDGD